MRLPSSLLFSLLNPLLSTNSKRPACLPYLGAYLDQIWSLEMSKSTKNSQGLINFGKMQSVSDHSVHYCRFVSGVCAADACVCADLYAFK